MAKFIQCEDAGSGYEFWKVLFNAAYPNVTVVSQKGNSKLSKAAEQINDDGNQYYIMIDTAIDNPDVLRELTRFKKEYIGQRVSCLSLIMLISCLTTR